MSAAEAPDQERAPRLPGRLVIDVLAIIGIAIAAVAAWITLIPGFTHGYDLSDEAGYLIAADPPAPTVTSVGFFGFYLHPVYAATGYNVPLYRTVGAVLLFAAGAFAGWSLWRLVSANVPLKSRGLGVLFAGTMAIAALGYYSNYLITPSYNWMTILGMLVGIGALMRLIDRSKRRLAPVWWVLLLSFGLFLTAVARPTSGPLLWIPMIGIMLWLSPLAWRRRWQLAGISVAFLVLCTAFHFVFIASLDRSVEILRDGSYLATFATQGGLLGLVNVSLDQFGQLPAAMSAMAGLTLAAGLLPLIGLFFTDRERIIVSRALAALALVFVAAASYLRGGFQTGIPSQGPAWLALLLVAATAFAAVRFADWRTKVAPAGAPDEVAEEQAPEPAEPEPEPAEAEPEPEPAEAEPEPEPAEAEPEPAEPEPSALRLRTVLVLACLSVWAVLVFGIFSTNGVVVMLMFSSVLVVLAILTMIAGTFRRDPAVLALGSTAALSLIVAVAVPTVLRTAAEQPYRTAPVAVSNLPTVVSWRGSKVLLGDGEAALLDGFTKAAQDQGWTRGTALVDLTPFTLGVGYRLGALTPPTMVLGLSLEHVQHFLARLPADVWCGAWVLTGSPPQGIDPVAAMPSMGMKFPDGYDPVIGYGRPPLMVLWKPKPAAVAACQAARG